MAPSFEQIADAGLKESSKSPEGKSFPPVKVAALVVFVLLIGAGVYFLYFHKLTPEVPESVEHLISVEGSVSGETMTHQIDDATEFDESLDYHKEEYVTPTYRETEVGAKAIAAAPAPEDLEAAELAAAEGEEELPFLIQKPVDKVKATLPGLFGESEEDSEDNVAVANAAVEAVDHGSITKSPPANVNGVESEPETIDADANQARVEMRELEAGADVEIDLVRDWSGVILVPDGITLSRAYSTLVSLDRVETHPIDGGRLRVWSRIKNLTQEDISVETACEFRFPDSRRSPSSFRPTFIPAGGAADVTFVSPSSGAVAYTLMVKHYSL